VAWAEAYLHAKFHLDPSNRLATIHQRYRHTDRTDRQRSDGIGPNGRPKTFAFTNQSILPTRMANGLDRKARCTLLVFSGRVDGREHG